MKQRGTIGDQRLNRASSRLRSAPRAALFTAAVSCVGCATPARVYEDVSSVDRFEAGAFDGSTAREDAAADRAPVVPLDRSVVDENGRRAARVFSFFRTCDWPRQLSSAQSIFLQLVSGFDAVFRNYVNCALRTETCTQFGLCVLGDAPPSSSACTGNYYYGNGADDIFDCGAVSGGQALCSARGCNDLRRCPTVEFVHRCDGEVAVDCNDLQTPIRSCPDVHPSLRCVAGSGFATCDIPDALAVAQTPGWSCDGTELVQHSYWAFGTMHSTMSRLPVARETRFDCARLGLQCDPRGACVDPAGECSFDPNFDGSGRLDSATQSYRHCFAGRWYAYPIVPRS